MFTKPMPPALRRLWLGWSVVLLILTLLLLLGIGLLTTRAASQLATPNLQQSTTIIGRSLALDIERAIHQQIPIDALVGIEPWFADIIKSNPILKSLALTDKNGKLLGSQALPVELRAQLSARRQSSTSDIGNMQVTTLPLHDQGGAIVGWLHIGARAAAIGTAPWLWGIITALSLTLLTSVTLWFFLRRRVTAPLDNCETISANVVIGSLPLLTPVLAHDPIDALKAALIVRINNVLSRQNTLRLKISEVRTAHFDPTILPKIDALTTRLDSHHIEAEAPGIKHIEQARGISLTRRVRLATALTFVLVVSGIFAIQLLHNAANTRQLISAAQQVLQHSWQATLKQDQSNLNQTLDQLLANPQLVELLSGNNNHALDIALTQAASPQLILTALQIDGTVLASSALHNNDNHVSALVLLPLQQGEKSNHGVWQNAARVYHSGVARRIVPPGGTPIILIAARPLESSITDLSLRLGAPVAVADLRGQPINDASTPIVAHWRTNGRHETLYDSHGKSIITTSITLTSPSGHALGTLLTDLPIEHQMTGIETGATWLFGILVLLAVVLLLSYLAWLLKPLTRATQQLEQLANGVIEPSARPYQVSQETSRLIRVRDQLAEKISVLETLRRSRERQGRRQARFIRHQMQQLATRLDANARRDILADLERIEDAGRPTELHSIDNERIERIADEFGILALGFQNLVSRVGEQYQEMDRLVQELREALRAKTQFIALQQELEIARKMQLSILPRQFKPRNGLELHATMLPAKEIGGDFYDFFSLDENRVALVVADVSGKGVPAAFFMAVSRTLLRAIAQFNDHPGHCLAQLNDLLAADNDELMFVTLFYAIFDTRDGSLIYANAGHNRPYLLRADGRVEVVPGTGGIALAVMNGVVFREGSLTLEPGDGLFLYTDGITEACGPGNLLYGDQRLVTALHQLRTLPVREIPAKMVALIKEFEAGGAQADDITCLMARYQGHA
ncbi:MAG: PP2C family protein-serine/threonine phosphatase [Herbaspirillum sp.]